MNKTNLTRREARTIPPEGGIFLCPERINFGTIDTLLLQLNREKIRSSRAKAMLAKAQEAWAERQEQGLVRSYGNELARFVTERVLQPAERTMNPENYQAVQLSERLFEQSNVFHGLCDAIRSTANGVSNEIAGQIEVGKTAAIGLHDYGTVSGPFGYELLSRAEPHSERLILFNWGGEVDGVEFTHAQLRDQIVLLSDVSLQYQYDHRDNQ